MSSRGSVDGCWSKIARAKEHRDLLESHSKQTFSVEANRPRFGAKFEADTSEYVFYVNYMPDLTAAFDRASLILGDAVANLRSALDYLVFQLAIWNTNGNVRDERNVQFPITDK